jgi:hypothetical protein
MPIIRIIAFLLFIVLWAAFRSRGKRSSNKVAQDLVRLKAELERARAVLGVEEQRTLSGKGHMTLARINERRRLLDIVESHISEAEKVKGSKWNILIARQLNTKADAALRAAVAYLQYNVAAYIDKANELDEVAKTAIAATNGALNSYPISSLEKMQELTARIRHEWFGSHERRFRFESTWCSPETRSATTNRSYSNQQ